MVGHQEDNSYRHYGSKLGIGKENKKGFLIQRSFEIHLGRHIQVSKPGKKSLWLSALPTELSVLSLGSWPIPVNRISGGPITSFHFVIFFFFWSMLAVFLLTQISQESCGSSLAQGFILWTNLKFTAHFEIISSPSLASVEIVDGQYP